MQGADCCGLLTQIYKNELGIELPDYLDLYENTIDHQVISKAMLFEKQSRWVDVDDPQEFDVIVLRIRNVPMHLGIVTKPKHMIHCSRGINTVHERFDGMRWKDKIIGYSRWVN